MTYEQLLDKWLRKLGRPCSAGEIVQDLRHLERPRNLYYEQLQKESDGELVAVVRCKDCEWCKPIGGDENSFYKNCFRHEIAVHDVGFCAWGERKEDDGETD